jgi:uncharacterized protein
MRRSSSSTKGRRCQWISGRLRLWILGRNPGRTALVRRLHSVLREEFGPDSDLDVLVEFEKGYRIGLIAFAGLELELSKILGRKVDLKSPADLSRYFRDKVLLSAELLYAQS